MLINPLVNFCFTFSQLGNRLTVKEPQFSFRQLDVIGPREWLGIMAGSLDSGWSRPTGNSSLGLALFQEYEQARIVANDNIRADEVANAS